MIGIIACPDCRGKLLELVIGYKHVGFLCEECCVIFPTTDGIPILLPTKARNYNLEYSLMDTIRQEAASYSMEWLVRYINRTLDLLGACQNSSSWEWEDEEYWSRAYASVSTVKVHKQRIDKTWQREFLVESLASQTSLRGKVIMDIGCGEGQTFRLLLSGLCDENTLYVAIDISLAGLLLNRAHNPHRNSLYVLCSADSLPFQIGTIDIICNLGILHHTERKAATISEHVDLLVSGGYMLVHEALSRPSPRLPACLTSKAEVSVHEERLSENELLTQLNSKELEIVASRRTYTVFFGGIMLIFRNAMVNSDFFFRVISTTDILLVKSLGHFIPFFRAGSTMLVLRKY